MNKIKEHLPEVIALAIPLIFILGVIVFLNLPHLKADPQYDFLFASHKDVFKVNREGIIFKDDQQVEKLAREKRERSFREEEPELEFFIEEVENELKIYRYQLGDNVKEDETEELSLEAARELKLSPQSQLSCPDGYTITYRRPERTPFGDMFGAPRVEGYYITQGSRSRELDIDRYQPSFSPYRYRHLEPPLPFIGWVLEENH